MWHDINTKLFLLINASEHASKSFIYFAIFCANYLIYLPIIVLVVYWFTKPLSRTLIIKVFMTLLLALLITFVIRHLFYSPRPFALEIGTNYLHHEKNSSLPSQHAVFIGAICFSVLFNYQHKYKKLILLFTAIAILICWSRIYLGIHWPLDIVIGFIISGLSAFIVKKIWIIFFKNSAHK